MRFAVGSATHQGQVRENNEDAFLVDNERELYAVADGMGGHAGGEVASRTAIEALRAAVASGTSVEAAIERAHDAVLNRAAADSALAGMGTTITALTPETENQLTVSRKKRSIDITAMALACSPPACPPMPSATANA